MHFQELSRNCWLIVTAVGRWLAEQDELTCALHQVAVETIQTVGDAPMGAFLTEFEAQYPVLFEDYGRRHIESKADAFLSSEFVELSALFSVFYEEFNVRYFEGSLPRYWVRVMHNVPIPEPPDPSLSYHVSVGRREIAIEYNGWPHYMLAYLLKFMASIRTGVARDAVIETELRRLQKIGAPTQDEVHRLQESGWKMFSAAPWCVS